MTRGVQWDDLPANVKARIQDSRRAELVRETPTKCGTVSRSWAAAERHADTIGHPRIELVLRVDVTAE